MAMAIACLRLLTRRRDPLSSLPRLCSPITLLTLRLCRDVAIAIPPRYTSSGGACTAIARAL